MIRCSDCGTHNMEGALFCDECGNPLTITLSAAQLSQAAKTMTQKLQTSQGLGVLHAGRPSTLGTNALVAGTSVILHFKNPDFKERLQLKTEIVFGRTDPNQKNHPDYDLSKYNALEQGVSRRHAALRRGEQTLTLVDLNSSNGTYLNGQKLLPNQPHIVRDGDEIAFGQLVCNIFFAV